MNQESIFGPFLVVMTLTVVVWFYMYSRRIPFIRSQGIDPNRLTPGELASRSPPSVSSPSDNLKNLFEVPVIFYTLSLYLYVTAQVDAFYVAAAWGFAALRIAHSAVHCTVNIVTLRFALYVLSCLCLFAMLARALIAYFA